MHQGTRHIWLRGKPDPRILADSSESQRICQSSCSFPVLPFNCNRHATRPALSNRPSARHLPSINGRIRGNGHPRSGIFLNPSSDSGICQSSRPAPLVHALSADDRVVVAGSGPRVPRGDSRHQLDDRPQPFHLAHEGTDALPPAPRAGNLRQIVANLVEIQSPREWRGPVVTSRAVGGGGRRGRPPAPRLPEGRPKFCQSALPGADQADRARSVVPFGIQTGAVQQLGAARSVEGARHHPAE